MSGKCGLEVDLVPQEEEVRSVMGGDGAGGFGRFPVLPCPGGWFLSGRRRCGRFWKGFAVRSLLKRVPRRYGRVWRVLDGRHYEKGQKMEK